VWFQKISIPPSQRVIGKFFFWGGGSKFLKESTSISLNWSFQRGGGFKPKRPSVGEYGYFLEQHNTKKMGKAK